MSFILLFAAASTVAHLTAGWWLLRAVPALRAHRRLLGVVIVCLVSALPVARFAVRHTLSEAWSVVYAVALVESIVALFGMAPLVVLYAFGALANRVRSKVLSGKSQTEAPRGATGTDGFQPSRRDLLAGAAAYGATGSLIGWGMVRGRHAFEVEEVVVKVAGLPRALEGYTIAQVSDIHVGVFVGERELREGFERVAQLKPDLIVATGDLVDFHPSFVPLLAQGLRSVPARDGAYAIVGNHDYYAGIGEVLSQLERCRLDVLVNDGKMIREEDGGGFALLGLDDAWAPRHGGLGPSLDTALRRVRPDAPRILLAHQPSQFDAHAGRIALQLSGHTHGGQINPGIQPARMLMPYVAGRYVRGNSTLWVNRGFGVAGPPSRVGAPPEVTKIILVAG